MRLLPPQARVYSNIWVRSLFNQKCNCILYSQSYAVGNQILLQHIFSPCHGQMWGWYKSYFNTGLYGHGHKHVMAFLQVRVEECVSWESFCFPLSPIVKFQGIKTKKQVKPKEFVFCSATMVYGLVCCAATRSGAREALPLVRPVLLLVRLRQSYWPPVTWFWQKRKWDVKCLTLKGGMFKKRHAVSVIFEDETQLI